MRKRTKKQKGAAKRWMGFQKRVRTAQRRVTEGRANEGDTELIARLEAEGERAEAREIERRATLAAFERAIAE